MSDARRLVPLVAEMLARSGYDVATEAIAIARSEHASSCLLYDVDVGDRRHALPPLLLKDLSPHASTPEAEGIRPAHLYDPLREIILYRRVLSTSSIGPRLYGSCVDRHSGASMLLIERLDALALDYIGELDDWRRAARAIGSMHARFADAPLEHRVRRRLIEVDGREMRYWLERAAGRVDALAPIARDGERLCAAFGALPRTLVHGELFASNVLVDEQGVYPIDWELAGRGPAVIDIAALSAGAWGAEERAALVEAWRVGLGDPGDGSARALELGRLYLALRLVGWSDGWTPPADEQHDWVAEAIEAHRSFNDHS